VERSSWGGGAVVESPVVTRAVSDGDDGARNKNISTRCRRARDNPIYRRHTRERGDADEK